MATMRLEWIPALTVTALRMAPLAFSEATASFERPLGTGAAETSPVLTAANTSACLLMITNDASVSDTPGKANLRFSRSPQAY
jgi:hypothetical protein